MTEVRCDRHAGDPYPSRCQACEELAQEYAALHLTPKTAHTEPNNTRRNTMSAATSLPPLRFPHQANPRAVTPEMLTTDEARDANNRVNAAVATYEELLSNHEVAVHKHQTATTNWINALTEAAAAGEDTSKIKAPAPYDETTLAAQLNAHKQAAISAATDLQAALVKALPEALEATTAEVEKEAQAVVDAMNDVTAAHLRYQRANNRRTFYRTLQRFPDGGLPIVNQDPNAGQVTTALDAIKATLRWRAEELDAQINLLDDQMKAARVDSNDLTYDEQLQSMSYNDPEQHARGEQLNELIRRRQTIDELDY